MRTKIFALTILSQLCLFCPVRAQQKKTPGPTSEKVLAMAEQMPVFPGGETALNAYFEKALSANKFPEGGVVTLSLVVDKMGIAKDIEVGMGLNPETDQIVVNTAKGMPKWQPGKHQGQPANVRVTFPVNVPYPVREETEEEKNRIFVSVEQPPVFPGGQAGFEDYIKKNLKYPAIARDNKLEGNVFIQFTVWKDGQIKDTRVAKGIHPEIDAEAIRLVNNMPKFTPGRQNGRPVNVRVIYPIRFKLD